MYQHNYDDNGLASSYLMLTIILPVALYQCYMLCAGSSGQQCTCKNCRRHVQKRSYARMLVSALLVLLVSYLIHNILTLKYSTRQNDFDPLAILGIEEGASVREIKRSYKKKMRALHMKLKRPKLKGIANKAIVNLNKAFQIVQDTDLYNKWLSNDSEKKLVIALPAFLMRFSVPSIGVYILVLGIIVPLFAYWRYSNIKYRCCTGAYYRSTESFYEKIETFSDNETILISQILLFISKTDEFAGKRWRRDISDVKREIENDAGIPLVSSEQGFLHLVDYVCRTGHGDPDDSQYARRCALSLVDAFIRIAVFKNKTKMYRVLALMRKMLVQAVFSPEFHMLQFPGVTVDHIVKNKEGAESGKDAGKNRESGPFDKMKDFLTQHLALKDLKDALSVFYRLPRVEIHGLNAYALNTENVTSNFNEKVEHIVEKEGKAFKIEKGVTANVEFRLVKKAGSADCHAPFCSETVRNTWSVFYLLNGEIQKDVFTFDHFEGEKNIKFTLPVRSGKCSVRVHVVSNGCFGVDVDDSLLIKYY